MTASPPAAPDRTSAEIAQVQPAVPGLPGEAEIADQIDEYLPNFGGSLEAARAILSLIRPAFEAKDAEAQHWQTRATVYKRLMTDAQRGKEAAEAKLAQAVEALSRAKDEIVRTADDLSMHSPAVNLVEEIATIIGQPALNSRAIVRDAASAAARGEA